MKYELAKELREAGFPQKHGIYLCEHGQANFGPINCHCTPSYIPKLEEIIEACPNMYDIRKTAPERGSMRARWIAEAWAYQMDSTSYPVQAIGSTPTEAVARLWLALTKKNDATL